MSALILFILFSFLFLLFFGCSFALFRLRFAMRLVSVADALATNSIYSSLHRATGRTAQRIHSVTCPICVAHPLEYLSSSNCNSCLPSPLAPPLWLRPCSGNCNLSLGHVACPHLQLWRDCSFSFTVTFLARPGLA